MNSTVIGDSILHFIVERKRRPTGVLRTPLVHQRAACVDGVENDNGGAEEARIDDITWVRLARNPRVEVCKDSPYFLPHSANVMCW